jgi:hypothetical protein
VAAAGAAVGEQRLVLERELGVLGGEQRLTGRWPRRTEDDAPGQAVVVG